MYNLKNGKYSTSTYFINSFMGLCEIHKTKFNILNYKLHNNRMNQGHIIRAYHCFL